MRRLLLVVAVSLVNNVTSFLPLAVSPRTTSLDIQSFADHHDHAASRHSTKDVARRVAVAGATGRTGRLVVQELLNRGVSVTAMVRSKAKAKEVFPQKEKNLEIVRCDLAKENDIRRALKGCDAAVWCATGFSDAETTLVDRFRQLVGMALTPKESIDSIGIPIIARCMMEQSAGLAQKFPRVVMCSSAGVTRPSWDKKKKEKFRGSSEIPIVRLNPFGILDVKAESETRLRESGVNYCIVRPSGLNDKWPAGGRPILSQGDVAVGRINRLDVANVLVEMLSAQDASEKTFEVFTLAGYPAGNNLPVSLARLKTDKEELSPAEVEAIYGVVQQFLPGERQDAAALAMGQTYEQLDHGQTGRLGKRGTENARAAAPKPSSLL